MLTLYLGKDPLPVGAGGIVLFDHQPAAGENFLIARAQGDLVTRSSVQRPLGKTIQ